VCLLGFFASAGVFAPCSDIRRALGRALLYQALLDESPLNPHYRGRVAGRPSLMHVVARRISAVQRGPTDLNDGSGRQYVPAHPSVAIM
jgi:hypothetical protein